MTSLGYNIRYNAESDQGVTCWAICISNEEQGLKWHGCVSRWEACYINTPSRTCSDADNPLCKAKASGPSSGPARVVWCVIALYEHPMFSACGDAPSRRPHLLFFFFILSKCRASLRARDEHRNASPRSEPQSSVRRRCSGMSAPGTDGFTALRGRMGSAALNGAEKALSSLLFPALVGDSFPVPGGIAGRPRGAGGTAPARLRLRLRSAAPRGRAGRRGGEIPRIPGPLPRAGTPR